jgi:hypothetical protein
MGLEDMFRHTGTLRGRGHRHDRRISLCLLPLERRTVPSQTFSQITGITLDSSGDVFVSYNDFSATAGQQQAVAEVAFNGSLINPTVVLTTGPNAFPGVLTPVGPSASLPNIQGAHEILELLPDGQLLAFDPGGTGSTTFDNLASYTAQASKVYDVQTGADVDLTGTISLANATYGDLGVLGSSLVVSAESNNWDFVLRLSYGAAGGVATVLAASPASDGRSASPGGVAVDPEGTVLTTLPYRPNGAATSIHVAVGFNLFWDQGNNPQPSLLSLGLTTPPDFDCTAITVDAADNFLLAVRNSPVYGGGPGFVHINSALTAYLADPASPAGVTPTGIATQILGGINTLAFTSSSTGTYTFGREIPLFSGQVTPAQVRHAYGVDQITFPGPGGTTVTGDGSGQTIAIVEEGVDPTIEADLHTFDQFFKIPDPPSFQVVYQDGATNPDPDTVGETALDVDWTHAIAPGASIVVYDAAYDPSDLFLSFLNLLGAMHQASTLPGVSVVTLSYGIPESTLFGAGIDQQQLDSGFTTPGVTFLASSGDHGIFGNGGSQVIANYPAASPNVVSVGGTTLTIDPAGDYPGTGSSGEVGWGDGSMSGSGAGSGGGLSNSEPEPIWQTGVVPSDLDPSGARAVPDVALDSGSAQSFDLFTSTPGRLANKDASGWLGYLGTSAGAPVWAGLIAIADQGRVLAGGTPLTGYSQTLPTLYSLAASDFHDIVSGNNGYSAGPGYDLVTGLGTPIANRLVPDLAATKITLLPQSPLVTVDSVQSQTLHQSRKKTVKVLVVGFSDALEPGPAQLVANYELVALGKAKKPGAHANKLVKLAAATYDPALHTVTLRPRGKLPNQKLQLTILGTGILDAEGRPIDANGKGQPGGNLVVVLGVKG